jgi:hypothetical protein
MVELECCPPCCSFHEWEDKDKGIEELLHTPKENFSEDTEKNVCGC